jgi:alkylhydroperoxidase/carboxymuconolactone decarboxylase family protein YurZ
LAFSLPDFWPYLDDAVAGGRVVDFLENQNSTEVGATDMQNSLDPKRERAAGGRLRVLAHWHGGRRPIPPAAGLNDRVRVLVGFGAALALGRPHGAIQSLTDHAWAVGVTSDQMLGTMLAVAPTIGGASVVANTPVLALALGYDVEAALEDPGTDAMQ